LIVTLTNTSGVTLNALDSVDTTTFYSTPSVAGLQATGGGVVKPLPYPFDRIGSLANSATKVLSMHTADWLYKAVPWLPETPAMQWNVLVQKGWVTLGIAAESTSQDQFDAFVHAV